MNTMQIARLSFAVTLAIVANACNAAVAVAFSESGPSGNNWAVVTNEPNTAIAGQKAVAECAKKTGKKDCKVLLSSDKKGYGALYATCVTERQCFTSAITGFPTRNAAHDAVLADCKQYYGVQSCMPWGDWNDSGAKTQAAPPAPTAAEGSPPGNGKTRMTITLAPSKHGLPARSDIPNPPVGKWLRDGEWYEDSVMINFGSSSGYWRMKEVNDMRLAYFILFDCKRHRISMASKAVAWLQGKESNIMDQPIPEKWETVENLPGCD